MAYIVKKSDIEIILQTQNQAWKEFLKGCIKDPNTTLHHDKKGCIAVNDGGNVVLLDQTEYRISYVKKVIDALDFKGNFYITDEPLDEDGYTLLELNINKYVVVEPQIIERWADADGNSTQSNTVEKIVEVPVETIVEKIVEVKVEVPVETIVEKTIEVEKIVEVEKIKKVEVAPKYPAGVIYQANAKGKLETYDSINLPNIVVNDTWKSVYPHGVGVKYDRAGYLMELLVNNQTHYQLAKWENNKGRVGVEMYNNKKQALTAQRDFLTG
jgi:hypothetical protein